MLGMCLPYTSSTFVNIGADCVESTFNPGSLRTVSLKTSNQVSTDLPQLDKMVDNKQVGFFAMFAVAWAQENSRIQGIGHLVHSFCLTGG